MSALELHNVGKRYGRETVLDDVSFELAKGETLVLFGPSGAGKSVLLRLIAGVVEPDEGRIFMHDRDMSGVLPEARGIGMAFQNFALFPHMSAFANIASPLEALSKSRDAIRSSVERVAKLLKIDHVLNHAPRELSNGQKQRTALARALAAEPELLLLDDPLRNVDAKLRFEMRLELPRLLASQGASVIYVTQDYKEAMALGDKIAVLEQGRITQLGSREEIYLNPFNLQIAQLFGDPTINQLDVVPERNGVVASIPLSGIQLPLSPGLAHVVDKPCLLGIRPEALRFAEAQETNAIPVTVETETPLNEKIVTLVVTQGGRELLVSRPAGTSAPSRGSAHIALNSSEALLLFDPDSGQRIFPRENVSAEVSA